MNVQHTERGNKWHVVNLKNQALKLAALLKRAKSNNWENSDPFLSIIAYYVGTLSLFPLFYGKYQEGIEVWAGSYNLAVYFLMCSLIPLFCLAFLSIRLSYGLQNATHITKILAVIYFLLLINNVVMAIDAVENLEQWIALDYLDTLINGSSDWLIPLGIADAFLVTLGVLCLLSRFYSLGDSS